MQRKRLLGFVLVVAVGFAALTLTGLAAQLVPCRSLLGPTCRC